MNSLFLLFSLFLTNAPTIPNMEQQFVCIKEEQIVKVAGRWEVSSVDVVKNGRQKNLVLSLHNPLEQNKKALSAKLFMAIDPAMPSDSTKYTLLAVQFYNRSTVVTFRRIFRIHKVGKDQKENFPIQTPCFEREVVQIH